MSKRYKIVVTEIGLEKRVVESEWKEGAGATDENPHKYGYTPEIEAHRSYERDVYQQTVDDLDLAKLVSVVNGIN